MSKEIWQDIKGYEKLYQISNLGRVRSLIKKHPKIIKQHNIGVYKRIGLSKNKQKKNYLVHKLVAETFIPNPENLPCVNHKDGNKENNNVNNLEWCTYQYNNRHARKTGLNKGNKGISYKNRCLKAIEYIEKGNKHFKENYNEPYEYAFMVNADEIMKILKGKSDE